MVKCIRVGLGPLLVVYQATSARQLWQTSCTAHGEQGGVAEAGHGKYRPADCGIWSIYLLLFAYENEQPIFSSPSSINAIPDRVLGPTSNVTVVNLQPSEGVGSAGGGFDSPPKDFPLRTRRNLSEVYRPGAIQPEKGVEGRFEQINKKHCTGVRTWE